MHPCDELLAGTGGSRSRNVPANVQLVPPDFFDQLATSLPRFLGAIALLVLGFVVALIAKAIVRGLLNRTNIDNRLVSWMASGQPGAEAPPIEKWISNAVFWIIMIFAIVAFFNALQLESVSAPLNSFLQQIFAYLPRVGGAIVLMLIAWLVATLSKLILTRGLARFNLDDRLAAQSDDPSMSSFSLNDTLGNALYWFVLLFFLPLVLDVLQLQGPLAPVQNLLDQILSALPKIITAVIIGGVGWLIARVVRGIVTNLLAAVGTDRIGTRVGLTRTAGGLSLSSLIGTIVYVLVLIPTAIAASECAGYCGNLGSRDADAPADLDNIAADLHGSVALGGVLRHRSVYCGFGCQRSDQHRLQRYLPSSGAI